eukprot:snap_masked-scaffold_8-processed-gene-13.20-mRNA-1 protein AED:1.00 eAED:1.00 QI:0/0/0/0/1/1/2/0/138
MYVDWKFFEANCRPQDGEEEKQRQENLLSLLLSADFSTQNENYEPKSQIDPSLFKALQGLQALVKMSMEEKEELKSSIAALQRENEKTLIELQQRHEKYVQKLKGYRRKTQLEERMLKENERIVNSIPRGTDTRPIIE